MTVFMNVTLAIFMISASAAMLGMCVAIACLIWREFTS